MEIALRAALIDWLKADPALTSALNAVVEEAPTRTPLPWLAIAASASTDWGTKDGPGREVRIAFELHTRGDRPGPAAALATALEARLAGLPRRQDGFAVVSSAFLRARTEQRPGNVRAILTEYRFRLLAA